MNEEVDYEEFEETAWGREADDSGFDEEELDDIDFEDELDDDFDEDESEEDFDEDGNYDSDEEEDGDYDSDEEEDSGNWGSNDEEWEEDATEGEEVEISPGNWGIGDNEWNEDASEYEEGTQDVLQNPEGVSFDEVEEELVDFDEGEVTEEALEDTEHEEEDSNKEYSPDNPEPEKVKTALSSTLNLNQSAFSIEQSVINLSDISPTTPLKNSRSATYKGLTQSVKELGILTPIHVLLSESYKSYLEEGGDPLEWDKEEFGNKYILIDGFRRVVAGLTNKIETVNALVWDFNDMDLAVDMLVPLSLLLNKSQKRNWEETWGLFTLLENISMMTPATLEFLLQLESGDAMKLKDVMLSGYQEVIDDLISENKTLDQSYKQLQKLRKEEDSLELEDARGISDIDGAEEVVGDSTEGQEQRTLDEVKKILDFDESDLESLTEDDFSELAGGADEAMEIDRRKGEDIPRELKQACLARDNYTCQISGYGLDSKIPMILASSVLQVHHIIPLYCGGSNHLDNLVTVRQDVHTQIHVIERLGGKLGVPKESFDELDEHDRVTLLKTLYFAKLIVNEAKKKGISIGDRKLQEASRKAAQYKLPGTDLKENMGVE